MSISNRAGMVGLAGLALKLVLLAALFIGFVYLLSYPWAWVLKAAVGLEVLLLTLVLMMEFSLRTVNGAGGWASFAYLMGHAWLFSAALVIRGVVLVGQWIFG